MTLYTLKHRDISQVNRMFEWLVGFVAGFAFAIGKAAKIDRVLDGKRFQNRGWTS